MLFERLDTRFIHKGGKVVWSVEQENNPGSELGADAHFTIDVLRPVP